MQKWLLIITAATFMVSIAQVKGCLPCSGKKAVFLIVRV